MLTQNEIRGRARSFSKDFTDVESESQDMPTFWDSFFQVFGLNRRRWAKFQVPVKLRARRFGRIDLFWPGLLLIEHKSSGENLTAAFKQATKYFDGIPDEDLPKYVLVSDFKRFRLYDLDVSDDPIEFRLEELHSHVGTLGFLTGRTPQKYTDSPKVNVKAAQLMADLHDSLRDDGYGGHPLAVLLVRLMFCMFADHTGLSERNLFRDLMEHKTREDGSDVGPLLQQIFAILDQPENERQQSLSDDLKSLRYINGHLFEERFDPPNFNKKSRTILLKCCSYNWSTVSPAIFGAMFQMVMDEDVGRRRKLGGHYTSEENILKTLRPLFLDRLHAEFKSANNRKSLVALLDRIAKIKILDPACGCGNFLVIAYRELRLLEIDIFRKLQRITGRTGEQLLGVQFMKGLDVDSMHGIEIEEFPCRVAETALYLMDHLMNMKASLEFGENIERLPLNKTPQIQHGNAIRIDWARVVKQEKLTWIVGNPPFIGKKARSAEQVKDMETIFGEWENHGELDYVSAWYVKALKYVKGTQIAVAFVSTNSLTQGEQVSILWERLIHLGVRIRFAHRTFRWDNDAPGEASVYCVIIGWGLEEPSERMLFEYETPKSKPIVRKVRQINPYLVDFDDVFVRARRKPLCDVPPIVFGSMANHAAPKRKDLEGKMSEEEIVRRTSDQLLLTTEEMKTLLRAEPGVKKWIRPFIGSDEFINGIERWCLWMVGITPSELRAMPEVMKRIQTVKENRAASARQATQRLAATPWLFGEIRQPDRPYIVVPLHSSELRKFIPMGMVQPNVIAGNACSFVASEDLFVFGVLQSTMHMAWVRAVCGRIKSDFRYSNEIVYNSFTWPRSPTDKQKSAVRAAAKRLLETRTAIQSSISGQKPQTLADLYDADVTPATLVKAHRVLDLAVDKCYRTKAFQGELSRVRFLFERYLALTNAGKLVK